MPSKSEKQRKYIFYLRGKYKDKKATPEKDKWIWDKDWEIIEEKTMKKIMENIEFENDLIKKMVVQIHQEYNNFLVYMKLSSQLNYMKLNGLNAWFNRQGREEIAHGCMIIDFLASQGYDYDILNMDILIKDLELALTDYSLCDIVILSLNREKTNTKRLYEILDCAINFKDGIIEEFLRKMIKEQEEEVDKFQTLLDKLHIAKDNPAAILMIDNEYKSL